MSKPERKKLTGGPPVSAMPRITTVGTGELYTDDDVPQWVQRMAAWAKEILVPDWTVSVHMADYPNPTSENTTGLTQFLADYMEASITFRRDIADDPSGWLLVCHEFAHVFLARMGSAVKHILSVGDAFAKLSRGVTQVSDGDTYDPQTVICGKLYDDAEEETVVKLSRILVDLWNADKVRESVVEKQRARARRASARAATKKSAPKKPVKRTR
jgi:hypothetical protein